MNLRVILFLIFLNTTLLSQESKTIYKVKDKIEYNFKGSFLLPHSPAISSLMNGTLPIYEIGIEFKK